MSVTENPMRRAALVLSLAAGLVGCGRPYRLIVLITVDTLRADHVGAYGATGLTPHLDHLASESAVFDNAYAPASLTLPSVAALMTSRYPEELGIRGNLSALPHVTTLASWLSNQGFVTGAVVSSHVLRQESGMAAGFSRYDDSLHQHWPTRRSVPERIAIDTARAALSLLDALREERGRPIFLWVHFQDPHGPYTPPSGYRQRFMEEEAARSDGKRELPVSGSPTGEGGIPSYQFVGGRRDPAFYRAGYKGEVQYMDEGIGHILDGLKVRGLIDQATLIFTADHGEGLGEDDYWFAHGERLHQSLVRVPLFLRVARRPPGRRSDVASLLDVFPTIASLLGGRPPENARGRDLLGRGAKRRSSVVYQSTLSETHPKRRGLVAEGYQLLLVDGKGPNKRVSLYRLGVSEALTSPRESAETSRMAQQLAAIRDSFGMVAETKRAGQTPEALEKLKSMGYVR
jgi:arylsulfatase A-like enzyme